MATFLADAFVIGLCRSAIADTHPQTRSSLHQPLEFLFICLPSLVPSLSFPLQASKMALFARALGRVGGAVGVARNMVPRAIGVSSSGAVTAWSKVHQKAAYSDDCMTNTTDCLVSTDCLPAFSCDCQNHVYLFYCQARHRYDGGHSCAAVHTVRLICGACFALAVYDDPHCPRDPNGCVIHLDVKEGQSKTRSHTHCSCHPPLTVTRPPCACLWLPVANRVLCVGDTSRCKTISKFLDADGPRFEKTSHREFHIITGTFNKVWSEAVWLLTHLPHSPRQHFAIPRRFP